MRRAARSKRRETRRMNNQPVGIRLPRNDRGKQQKRLLMAERDNSLSRKKRPPDAVLSLHVKGKIAGIHSQRWHLLPCSVQRPSSEKKDEARNSSSGRRAPSCNPPKRQDVKTPGLSYDRGLTGIMASVVSLAPRGKPAPECPGACSSAASAQGRTRAFRSGSFMERVSPGKVAAE